MFVCKIVLLFPPKNSVFCPTFIKGHDSEHGIFIPCTTSNMFTSFKRSISWMSNVFFVHSDPCS